MSLPDLEHSFGLVTRNLRQRIDELRRELHIAETTLGLLERAPGRRDNDADALELVRRTGQALSVKGSNCLRNADKIQHAFEPSTERLKTQRKIEPNPPEIRQQGSNWKPDKTIGEWARSHSLDVMEFSARVTNCLRKADIKTIGELAECSPNKLLRLKGFGV